MESIFTPNEAAALVEIPAKRVYQELEDQIITSLSDTSSLPFSALIYLRALKDINFEFSIQNRIVLYQRLVKALEENNKNVEIGRFFILQLDNLNQELSTITKQFYQWKNQLVTDTNIMGGETIFPESRLSVRRIGNLLKRGETVVNILEDYPFLSKEDLKFALVFVNAYPS